jgi:hypothetical protein
VQFDQPIRQQIGQGLLHPLLLQFHIQFVQPLRAGDQPQNAQGRGHGQHLGRLGQFQIAHQRRLGGKADIFVMGGVEEKFPGQGGQGRVADAQLQT